MILEICIDSVQSALNAEAGGAQRVELCDNLLEGGTTPSLGLVELVCERAGLEVMAMVRPRGGDFLYSELEFETMKRDIRFLKRTGVTGVVFGLLTADGQIDTVRTAELVALARPMQVTFHRAFDMAVDPYRALDDLLALGIERLLTSGQAPSAFEGRALIAELVQRAGNELAVMAGAGVRPHNIGQLVKETGIREAHSSARSRQPSGMLHFNQEVFMGAPGAAEYEIWVTDPEQVRALLMR